MCEIVVLCQRTNPNTINGEFFDIETESNHLTNDVRLYRYAILA